MFYYYVLIVLLGSFPIITFIQALQKNFNLNGHLLFLLSLLPLICGMSLSFVSTLHFIIEPAFFGTGIHYLTFFTPHWLFLYFVLLDSVFALIFVIFFRKTMKNKSIIYGLPEKITNTFVKNLTGEIKWKEYSVNASSSSVYRYKKHFLVISRRNQYSIVNADKTQNITMEFSISGFCTTIELGSINPNMAISIEERSAFNKKVMRVFHVIKENSIFTVLPYITTVIFIAICYLMVLVQYSIFNEISRTLCVIIIFNVYVIFLSYHFLFIPNKKLKVMSYKKSDIS